MALVVQKYGGSSVATLPLIQSVAKKIKASQALGHELVVVVSAMAGETDRLDHLARSLNPDPNPRELDVLLATGEQVSVALLCLALQAEGVEAVSLLGHQVPIVTQGQFNQARIADIDDTKIRTLLSSGKVVVVAGFQGMNLDGDITTLGRGGSDTTAVALAAALGADECQIYTDVDGVYTADPRLVKEAKRLDAVGFPEMLALSSSGAKVLQSRAVEFAGRYQVPLRVLSSFGESAGGTKIAYETNSTGLGGWALSGIAFSRSQSSIGLFQLQQASRKTGEILQCLSDSGIEADTLVQTYGSQSASNLLFTVHRNRFEKALQLIQSKATDWGAKSVLGQEHMATLSMVGIGLQSRPDIASHMLNVLGERDIPVHLMTTSDMKISVVVDEAHLDEGVQALHQVFHLQPVCEETKESLHKQS